jgi:transcriptional regulator with XRE-family HTH domain
MYKNRHTGNRNNICGSNIARLRKGMEPRISQRALADKLQIIGLDIDKNAVQRIESGKRFVTDIELLAFSRIFGISADELLKEGR